MRTGEKRYQALLLAEAANPALSSVALIGWSMSRALMGEVDGLLVTELRNREAIEREGGVSEGAVEYIDNRTLQNGAFQISKWIRGGKSLGWTAHTALNSMVYPFFEKKVWAEYGDRIQAGEFDVVHRITPVSPTAPSLLARKCAEVGVPFVLGPINGGTPWPDEFAHLWKKEREWLAPVRSAHRWMPGFRRTRAASSAILLASKHAFTEIPEEYLEKCLYLNDNAFDVNRFPEPPGKPKVGPLRVVFIGRLVPYKGADMLIEAVAPLVREGKVVLDLIGDGPERGKLEKIVDAENIGGGVTFPGWLDHRKVHTRLGEAHVFAFPSVREFGGGVVLEAMGMGVVPVVLDHGGPPEFIGEGMGYAMPMGNRDEVVARFRGRLDEMVGRIPELLEMGARCREHVLKYYTWEAKARQLKEVYAWVCGNREGKPCFGFEPRGLGLAVNSDDGETTEDKTE